MKENVNLAPYTTFRIGGPARYFFEARTVDDLKEAAKFAQDKNLPVFILGGGSNILVRDEGFPGVVIKISLKGVEIKDKGNMYEVSASAGEVWDDLVELLVSKNIGGLENLSAIPGSLGAAPVQNIGAYGAEVSLFVKEVGFFDTKNLKEWVFNNKECRFSYRDSIFKQKEGKGLIVTKVLFSLPKKYNPNISYRDLIDYFSALDDEPTAVGLRRAVVNIRNAKLPDVREVGTAGSFFKNPIVNQDVAEEMSKIHPEMPVWKAQGKEGKKKLSAAYLIDKICNMKGLSVGGVGIWKNQALVLVNEDGASASDVLSVAEKMKSCVKEKTGIILENEVQVIG